MAIAGSTEPPLAGTPGERSLPPGSLRYENARAAIGIVGATLVALAAILLLAPGALHTPLLVALAIVAVGAGGFDLLVLNGVRVRSTSYTATADYVYLVRGRWLRRSVLLPTAQILGVEVSDGLLLRWVGLVRVSFVTIADGIEIASVTPAEADAVRALVLRRGDAARA